MTNQVEKAFQYVEENKNNVLSVFKEFLSIPSISSDPDHANDIISAAHWVKDYLDKLGVSNTALLETGQHPVVFGEYQCGDDSKPTILIYGQYDVQPPDPLDLWKSEPFIAEISKNRIFARGASDMKGQIMVFLSAIEAIVKTGSLSVNLKFMIEGEEEIGSPSIETFLEKHKDLFKCDFVLNLDAGSLSKTQPSIVYGLRGLAYFEIHVSGPDHDLHSGLFGGVVRNPVQVLAELLSGMIDEQGIIQLPGFYDDVMPIGDDEKSEMAKLGLDEDYYKTQTGVDALFGDSSFSPTERIGARPTLDINGILGGFTGVGPKTIIPSKSMAKISMRLVPNQTPRNVYTQLVRYLEKNAPNGIKWQLIRLSGDSETPYVTNPNAPETQCFAEALKTIWGVDPIHQREGGTIPIASNIQNILGASSILSGFGLPEDKIHSPNESMDLDMFWKGIHAVILYLIKVGEKCN